MSKITFRLTAGTHVGCIRTNNEDNFIINENLSQSDWFIPQDTSRILNLGEDGAILVVADGMGGLNAGEVASAIAIETLKQTFLDTDLKKVTKKAKTIEKFMRDIVVKSDQAIKKHVKNNPETHGMGTTLIFAWIYQGVVYLMWCGDSRAYIYNGDELRRLSKDHSYVQELVDAGKLEPELAFDHPNSNIVTRCLGDFQDKARPEFVTYALNPGDLLLLCSDGLCGLCRDEDIFSVLKQYHSNLEQCKQQLIQAALDAGGYDNVTVALFETVEAKSVMDVKSEKGWWNYKKTKEVNDLDDVEASSLSISEICLEEKENQLGDSFAKQLSDETESSDEKDSESETDTENEVALEGDTSNKRKYIYLLGIILVIMCLCYYFRTEIIELFKLALLTLNSYKN